MKNDAARLTDTTQYLKTHLSAPQYNEVVNLINASTNIAAISADLSVGNASLFNAGVRRAKRCLMLLAALFIDKQDLRTAEVARAKSLPEGSEAPLIAEIKSWFTVPGVNAARVAQFAVANIAKMPKWDNADLRSNETIRGVYSVATRPFNCYNSCIFYAFHAGAISKRYLWNNLQGNSGDVFFPIYSRVGWTKIYGQDPDGTVNQDDYHGGLMDVPTGRTVYFETPGKVFGHVAWSLGDGKVISQNSVIDFAPAALQGPFHAEWEKMSRAVTHIIPIREMITYKFNSHAGYKATYVSNGAFWDPIPAAER